MKSSRTTLENPPVGFRLEADSERVLAPRAGVCTVPHPFEDGTDVAQAAPVECAAATANEPRMNIELLPAVELETGPNPTAAIVWLHGLGADGNDFVPIVGEMKLPAGLPIRFVFPHAPVRPVTLNNGFRMRAWYDLAAGDITSRADIVGVRDSQAHIEALIAREKARGIEARRIVMAGFSQGGVMALYTGVRHAERLAGIVALSTYVVAPEKLADEGAAANRDVPIFMAHGTFDPMVRPEWGEAGRRALVAAGYRVDWHTYPMPHSVVWEEVEAISAFLARVLA